MVAYLLAIQHWRQAAQEPHQQPNETVPPVIENMSNRRPPPRAELDPFRPHTQIQTSSSTPMPFADDATSIAGKVLDQHGKELPDIRVIALPKQIFGHKARRRATARSQETWSDAFGQYKFDDLVPGEYQIQAEETPEYTSNRIFVRVGADNADLVLSTRQELWVYGHVENYRGAPLRGVRVVPNGMVSDSVYTDHNGKYEIYITRQGSVRHPDRLHFSLPDYNNRLIRLPTVDLSTEELALRNVLLRPVHTPGFVRGIVLADNFPVADAKVYLRSRDSKSYYYAVTDDEGSFEIQGLAAGRYAVRVVAGKQYQDYQESGLRVDALGSYLSIELEAIQFGQLTGQMVDPEGIPVPRFTLWMTSDSALGRGSRPVTGDQQGFFSINRVPYGDQNFRTHSTPKFRIKGVQLTPYANKPMQLVLDWGPHTIVSQVTDTNGQPLPGTAISLTWEQVKDRTTYHSVRNTMADNNGQFRFSQLSAGLHTLRFNIPGYKRRYRLYFDVGSDEMPVVRLPAHSK